VAVLSRLQANSFNQIIRQLCDGLFSQLLFYIVYSIFYIAYIVYSI